MKHLGAYFDKNGELHIPPGTLSPESADLGLSAVEWLFLLVVSAENYPGNHEKFFEAFANRTTLWRAKKRLMSKGLF